MKHTDADICHCKLCQAKRDQGSQWLGIRVTAQREFFAERVIKEIFRDRQGIEVRVPVRHVVRKAASRVAKRAVRTRPFLPGVVFIGVHGDVEFPLTELERLPFVHGLLTGQGNIPIIFRELDMMRIFSEMNQHPRYVRKNGRRRQPGETLEITDGPYEGRIARVQHDKNVVTFMALTGTTKEFDQLGFDNGLNQRYETNSGRPLAVAGPIGQSSKGGPADTIQQDRGCRVPKLARR